MKILMNKTMRWYGPKDPVSLDDIRQSGCEGVVSALHQIPVGDVWEIEDIQERKEIISSHGLEWKVIESLPVHEDIKRQRDGFEIYLDNYKQSLINLGQCGLEVITYNFMPVLDWVRTDVEYEMPSGARALYFHRLSFIAFDLYMLDRPGAHREYTEDTKAKAKAYLDSLSTEAKDKIYQNVLLGLPGSDDSFTPEIVLSELEKYAQLDSTQLKEHLFYFLRSVVPIAEANGLKMAIHPDDPPYCILGLPRIVSTQNDLEEIMAAVDSEANGLCFCTGSLGARSDNDVPAMLDQFQDRIHFLHLRNTKRDAEGNFYEADHLGGDTDMSEVVKKVVSIMNNRGISIPMRPDHGHQMLDDLNKKFYSGYSVIGRLKGLAELRGLEYGLAQQL